MFTAAMLAQGLQDHVLRLTPGHGQRDCTGGITLLAPGMPRLEGDHLYLGECAVVLLFLQQRQLPAGCIVAVAGDSPALRAISVPPDVCLLVTDLDLLHLYNRAHRQLHLYNEWLHRLDEVLYRGDGLQALVDCASRVIPSSILVLNAGYKPLAASYREGLNDATTRELQEKGYLSFDSVHALMQQHALRGDITSSYSEYVSSVSGKYTIVRLLTHDGNVVARICLVLDDSRPNPFITDLSQVLEQYVSQYMFNARGGDPNVDTDFATLAADLIEYRLTDPAELEERLKQVRLAFTGAFYVMLLTFPRAEGEAGRRLPWNYLIGQLEQLFPYSNIAVYRGSLLLLIRRPSMNKDYLSFDRAELTKLLDYYGGYAALGNSTDRLLSLPPLYHQVRAAVRLGRALAPAPGKRIFQLEESGLYQTIELALRALPDASGAADPAYLCHPAFLALLRHDRETDGTLCTVLRTYLDCACNSTETAKQLNIHRNTMLYKLHRIEEVLGRRLDNAPFRDRLRLSLYVADYAQRVLRIDLLTLHRHLPERVAAARDAFIARMDRPD